MKNIFEKIYDIDYEKLITRIIAMFFVILIISTKTFRIKNFGLEHQNIIDYIILCVSILALIFSNYKKVNESDFKYLNFVFYIFVSSWLFFMFFLNNTSTVLLVVSITLSILFLTLISKKRYLIIYYSIVISFLVINIFTYDVNLEMRLGVLIYAILIVCISFVINYKKIDLNMLLSYKYELLADILNSLDYGFIVFDSKFELLKENFNSKKLLGDVYIENNIRHTISNLLNYQGKDLLNHIEIMINKSEVNYIEILDVVVSGKHLDIYFTNGKKINKDCFIMFIMDNSEQFKNSEKIKYLSNHDTLTYLPKREFLKSELESRILKSKGNMKCAVIFIDLDRFKDINESYGFSVGDIVITKFSERLKRVISEKADCFEKWSLARSNADEFILILYNYKIFSDITTLVEQIMFASKEAYYIYEIRAHISCSLGISFYPENGLDSEELFKNASLALFNAKKLGGNLYQIYEKSIYNKSKGIHIMEEKINDAMDEEEIAIYYQPIIDTKNNIVGSAEALSRWIDHSGKIISPDIFIPILERTGLIKNFDIYVTRHVIDFINRNENLGFPAISINISATTYSDLKVIQQIEEIIKENKACDKIRLEITETTAMSDVEYSKFVISELSRSGIKMLLDDFGSGYSSLKYLRDFSFDIVKIDKELVQNVDVDKSVYSVLKACSTMGKELGFEVLAEGVEKKAELDALLELDFRYIQGYYYSKPLREDEFILYVKSFGNL